MATTVDRLLPDDEARALLDLAREIAEKELAPRAAEAEAKAEFPADAYRVLGKAGLLSLPFEERYGGGAQPYETYLQVVEEIATAWASVGRRRLGALADLLGARPQRLRRAARGVAAADALG